MNRRGVRRLGKKAATVTDTATYPFWAINLSEMVIFPHDVHGKPTGPSEKVRNLAEAYAIVETRNYPERKGKA